MSERLTMALDSEVAAQLRHVAAESGETLESLAGRLLEVAARLTSEEGPGSRLSEDRIADLKRRLKDPGPFASDQGVEAFFARFGA